MTGIRSRGFTLLEVLVSVAILAVAMTAIMQSFSQGFFTLRKTEGYAIATLQAQSKLAEVGPLIPVAPGFHNGEYENGYEWQVDIQETGLPAPVGSNVALDSGERPGNLKAYAITVSVSWDENQEVKLQSTRVMVGQ
ncbi:MAG: prepilin-type N-terminal cleavage/methylation domain-containing protein [Pseudomonadota bacterium]